MRNFDIFIIELSNHKRNYQFQMRNYDVFIIELSKYVQANTVVVRNTTTNEKFKSK